ncbi:MAG: HAMP domain-containing protein [Gammaproteobacteria bacterium]|nr:HAMP domain-containing protein [Gammaproteobacteria bacterium]MCP5424711.1 HAMP domain-containing protein [Gammaproteobacteria bacterium]MCP5459254.1 HAMP domain-containing protein [Gammaproteobacteria bacterium]
MRLFRTSVFRLSLLYACAYGLLSALGLGFTYWSTASHSQAQIDARLRLETDVLLNLYQTQALPALAENVRRRNRSDGQRKIFFYLLASPDSAQRIDQLHPWPKNVNSVYATLRFSDVFQDTRDWVDGEDRVRVLMTVLPNNYRLLVGRDLNDERALLNHNLRVVLLVIVITVLLATLGSVVLGRHTLRRIDAVNRTANAIVAGDLTRRVAITPRNDEFDELGRMLNAMLERIEQLMTGMRQVTDNVAHDLRSPLNRLRNRLDITLLEARTPDEYRSVLEQSIGETDEILKTFNALLSIAQAEAGIQRDWSQLDLATLVEDLADLYGALAEERGIAFHWSIESQAQVRGNRQLLAQALSNLLDNAVKYTPTGGHIELKSTLIDKAPALVVSDSGPGIPSSLRERVLERFVRLDNARSSPGNGLGLSLVKAVARLHGAVLRLEDNQPGLRVMVVFDGRYGKANDA